MKKYQIVEVKTKENHAGSKARDDACLFAKETGFEVVPIKCQGGFSKNPFSRIVRYVKPGIFWILAYFKIEKNSAVLLQHPFYDRQMGRTFILNKLIKKKNCKIISLIHDAEFLRGGTWANKSAISDFEFVKEKSHFIIVHNQRMFSKFKNIGIEESRLVSLEIFDYQNSAKVEEKDIGPDVVIAGNLAENKAPYAYKLSGLGAKFGLYGPNFAGEESDNVKYYGSFPADTLPATLFGKFGLVWDGDQIETCAGETGNYLRYNNPHKTSLYIVSRIPIVIWDEAAMADFVKEKGIGITVSSLTELESAIAAISDTKYQEMKKNIEKEALKLESGYYLKEALRVIIEEKLCL